MRPLVYLFLIGVALIAMGMPVFSSGFHHIYQVHHFPQIDVVLEKNTDICFTKCEAVMKIVNKSQYNILLPHDKNNRIEFRKKRGWVRGIEKHAWYVQKKVLKAIPIKVASTKHVYVKKDANGATCHGIGKKLSNYNANYCTRTETVFTPSTRYELVDVWKKTLLRNIVLKPGINRIKLVGWKKPGLGDNSVDWVATIKGHRMESWAWWGGSWNYKQPITIDNTNNSSALSDYVVKVHIDSSNSNFWAHVKADGHDVRFVDTNEAADGELSHWVEDWDNVAQDANIWVKIPSIPASNSKTIYLYYGNAAATDDQNGFKTFKFFDNFDGSQLSALWTNLGGTVTVSGGILSITNGTNNWEGVDSVGLWGATGTIRGRIKFSGSTTPEQTFAFWNGSEIRNYGGQPDVQIRNVTGGETRTNITAKSANWVDMQLSVNSGLDDNGWIDGYKAASNANVSNAAHNIRIAGGTNTYVTDANWVFFADWTAPEPALSFGAETSNLSNTDLNYNSPVSGYYSKNINPYFPIDLNAASSGNPSLSLFYSPTAGAQKNLLYGDLNLNIGTVGWWQMNDGSGTTATDFSGFGNNGTLTNFNFDATDGWVAGPDTSMTSKGALKFDGTNDYVSTNLSGPANSFSVMMWVSIASTADQEIVEDYGGNNKGFRLFYSGGQFLFQPYNGTGAITTLGTGGVSQSTWYFLVAVYDGSAFHFYLDGADKASYSSSAYVADDGTQHITIGRASWLAGNYFTGTLSDVRIYNRALSPAEIKQIYNNTQRLEVSSNKFDGNTIELKLDMNLLNKGTDLTDANLVGYWPLMGGMPGQDGNVRDFSQNHNNGTLHNFDFNSDDGFVDDGNRPALKFDGTDDELIIANGAEKIANATVFTWVGWVKPTGTPQTNHIIVWDGAWDWYVTFVNNAGSYDYRFVTADTVPSAHTAVSTAGNYLNHWAFVAAKFDNGNMQLFINGVLEGSATAGSPLRETGNTLRFGRDNSGSDAFQGLISDARIYNRALTPAEIEADYNAGIADGNYYVDVNMVNSTQTRLASSGSLSFDSTPPTTTDNAPTGWRNANFNVTLTCTDATSGCSTTQYRVDSGSWVTGNTVSITTDGNHQIDYNSTDNAGNIEATHTVYAALDKTAPSVGALSITLPTSYTTGGITYVKAGTIDWNATVSDSLSGIDTATCKATIDEGTTWPGGTYTAPYCAGSQSVANATSYVLGIRISDSALPTANTGTSAYSQNYTGDTLAPVTTDDVNHSWQSSNQVVSLSCNDSNGSGCATGGTLYCIDTTGTCTPATVGTSVNVTCSQGQVCQEYVRYDSNDNLGNTESVETSASVRIDKNNPKVIINSPADGNTFAFGTNIVMDINDQDNGSGASHCDYNVVSGGSLTKTYTTRTCSSTFTVTVGKGADCNSVGVNSCVIGIRAQDNVGNYGYAYSTLTITYPVNFYFFDENTDANMSPTVTIDGNDYSGNVVSGLLAVNPAQVFAQNKTYTIEASQSGYATRNWQWDFNSSMGLAKKYDLNLGMVQSAQSAEISFTFDFNNNTYANDFVEVRNIYDLNAAGQRMTYAGRAKTDSSGKASFYLNPANSVSLATNTLRYNFIIRDDGSPDGNIISDFNSVAVHILKPIDEITLAGVSPYTITGTGIYGFDENNVDGAVPSITIYALPEASNYVFEIGDTPGNYTSRIYTYIFDANVPDKNIQPYLVSTDALTVIFRVVDRLSLTSLTGYPIKVYKNISGTETLLQQGISDAAGQVVVNGRQNDTYTIKAYDPNNNLLTSKDISFTQTSFTIEVDTSNYIINEGTFNYLNVSFSPNGGAQIDLNLNNVILSQTIDANRPDINRVYSIVSQGDNNIQVQNSSFTSPLTFNETIASSSFDRNAPITVRVLVQFTDGNVQWFTAVYLPKGQKGNLFDWIATMRKDMPNDFGCKPGSVCYPLIFLALFASLIATASLALSMRLNNDALIAVAILMLGFFTYVWWFPLPIYLLLSVMGIVAFAATRRVANG